MRTVCLAMLLAVLAVVTGCGGDGEPEPLTTVSGAQGGTETPTTVTSPSEPQTVEAAKALAQAQVDAFAAGDYAGTWDMWSAEGKAAISREDYVRFNTECPSPIEGVAIDVTSARLENPTTSVVIIKTVGVTASYNVVYQDGKWRWQPNPDGMAKFATGVDAMVANGRSNGQCG